LVCPASLHPRASLSIEQLDKGIVWHIVSSLDEFLTLHLDVIGRRLEILVHGLLLHRSAMTLRIHILHVRKPHVTEVSELFSLHYTRFIAAINVVIVSVFVNDLNLLRVVVILSASIRLCVHKLADDVCFRVVPRSEKFFNRFDSPNFNLLFFLLKFGLVVSFSRISF
jgi:hypothetical protein